MCLNECGSTVYTETACTMEEHHTTVHSIQKHCQAVGVKILKSQVQFT